MLENEEKKLDQIFLDSWEFQGRNKVVFRNNSKSKEATEYSSTKLYLAEKSILNSRYEIRKAKLDGFEFETKKEWTRVSKNQIFEYLNELKLILKNAIENNQIVLSTYY